MNLMLSRVMLEVRKVTGLNGLRDRSMLVVAFPLGPVSSATMQKACCIMYAHLMWTTVCVGVQMYCRTLNYWPY